MDKEFDAFVSGDVIGTLLNTYANNMILSLAEDDDQKDMMGKVLKAFNRNGVSTATVIKALADAFKAGDFENG